ncbi:unnamed protein product [Phyllotreta striolata]|uniref:HYDIN/VesB/CFA65-like Ig-like domain-containing protein n=1 Tax=Phyllotreta striolata TaxID=444603 RepID=A0A9P0DXD3_PHYSR|nr:unnamed protein product [Phyllotreta striolata]
MEEFCPSAVKCEIMELLPFFLDVPMYCPLPNIPPSRLLAELQMPMQKRFEQLSKPTRKRRILTELNSFMRTPDIILFQNFQPYQNYKTTLTFVNITPISKHFKLKFELKSPFFKIIPPPSDLDFTKIAPGIAYVVTIIFTPSEMRDYVTKLVCETDDESFFVSIYGLGNRPLMKIADEIKLDATAIRVTSEKSILLYNLAEQQGQICLTVSEPFVVKPTKYILEGKKVVELKVACTPVELRDCEDLIQLNCYDVVLNVPVSCEVQDADITMNCNSLNFTDVYMGLENFKAVTVENNSPFTIDFSWKLLESKAEDAERIKNMLENLNSFTEYEKLKYNRLLYYDIVNVEGHQSILDYKLCEAAASINEEFKLIYTNEAFSILPLEGKILPHQTFKFDIIFAPSENKEYTNSAYLDVTGKHERFKLDFKGTGKGPSVIFNVDQLSTGTIFMEAKYQYQIIVKNDGFIPATVEFQKTTTEFGGEIKCSPRTQYLSKTDDCKPFVITFSSCVQGPFIERVYFQIKECEELIYFVLLGNVVCPLLEIDSDKLDFGQVAFATEVTKSLVLKNNSQVPIGYQVKMLHLNHADMLIEGKKEMRQDFGWEPTGGVVAPYNSATIDVKLFTTVIGVVNETLRISMYGTDAFKIDVPCSYECLIPMITCEPDLVYIKICFLNYEYRRTLTFKNEANYPGTLNYTPEEEPKNMQIRLSTTELVVPPQGQANIDLVIATDVLGFHEFPLMFTLFGMVKPTTYCNLTCNGYGPVVSYLPDVIHFGQVQLLTTAVKQMSLVNDSPIPAKVYLTSSSSSEIRLAVDELSLLPESEVKIDVVCYLTEDGKIDCQLFVDVENGENIVIKVTAEGIGYPIKCTPKLEPVYDLGSQLTYLTNRLPITISNLGRKYYRIYWSRRCFIKSLKELTAELEETQLSETFWFEPHYIELEANVTEMIDICARSKTARYHEEMFYMYGTFDTGFKSNPTQTVLPIMQMMLKVKFIIPVISFSSEHLKFVEMHVPNVDDPSCYPDDVETTFKSIITREVIIRNEVEIPLTLTMRTSENFYIKLYTEEYEDTFEYTLDVGREIGVTVEFQPQIYSKRYVKLLGKLIVNIPEYPKTESIYLTGEICYPTVQFLPQEVDFGCLELDSYSVKSIILQNTTFLPVKFTLELLMDSFHIEELQLTQESAVPEVLTIDNASIESFSVTHGPAPDPPARSSANKDDERDQEELEPPEADLEDVEGEDDVTVYDVEGREDTERTKDELIENVTTYMEETEQFTTRSEMTAKSENLNSMKMTYSSRMLFATPEPVPQISEKQVKDATVNLINTLLYNTYEEPYSTELTTPDFWREMQRKESKRTHMLRNILTIEPWEGYLKPYEYCLVNIYFSPPPNTIIQCSAVCKIEGGEQERVYFKGSCSYIYFRFDKSFIDVGRKLFCEIFETSITLTNTGFSNFPVMARCDDEEIFNDKKIKAKWLNVSPKSYFLEVGKSVTFNIKYFPGMSGAFEEDIIFDVSYMDPIRIPMRGYGVCSQITINLPRLPLRRRYLKLGYRGIANVDEKYLIADLPPKSTRDVMMSVSTKLSLISRNIDRYAECRFDAKFTRLKEEDWEVIFRDDPIPSKKDLELAVEHTILNEHLCNNYDELKKHSIFRRCRVIPDFKVPPYKLDFGKVVIDTSMVFSLRITNISPEPTYVKVVKSSYSTLYALDMVIDYKPTMLGYGESFPMHVIFKPSSKRVTDEKCVQETLDLEVSHGAIVPILISATICFPRVAFKHKSIDFGMVKIGNALRKTVIIENLGSLSCNWDTDIRSLNDMKPLYYTIPNKGELPAFQQGVMNIYFMPEKRGFYVAEVIVNLQGSSKQVKMKLCGDGVQPTLVFKDSNVKFDPCTPYASDTIPLYIQNVSTFPIEFCFSDFEHSYSEEKLLIGLFLNYYNLKTVLIPERRLGAGIPEIFVLTYEMLEADLKDLYKNLCGTENPLVGVTKHEIIELINRYINSIIERTILRNRTDNTTDMYQVDNKRIEGLAIIDPVVSADGLSSRKGIVIVFHGAPTTDYLRIAFRSAKFLSLKTTSVDALIMEQLVNNDSKFAEIVNFCIDEALKDFPDTISIEEFDDNYDILYKKLDVLLNMRHQLPKRKAKDEALSKIDLPREVFNDPTKKKKTETFLDLNITIFADMLKYHFEKNPWPLMVIETLDSIFIKQPLITLECLLHGIGNMKYVQIVTITLSLEEYVAQMAKIAPEPDEEELAEITPLPVEIKIKKTPKGGSKKTTDRQDTASRKSDALSDESDHAEAKLAMKAGQIMRDLSPEFVQKFRNFDQFVLDLTQVCEVWDRTRCVLTEQSDDQGISKVSKKRTNTTLLSFTEVSLATDVSQVGVPIMIIRNIFGESEEEDLLTGPISRAIFNDEKFESAFDSIKNANREEIQESTFMYSVIKKKNSYQKNLSNVFKIVNAPSPADHNVDEDSLAAYPGVSSVSLARPLMAASVGSIKFKKKKLKGTSQIKPLHSFKDEEDVFTSRTVIGPGDIHKYEITFNPQYLGTFSHKYRLEIIGYSHNNFIKCLGNGQLPCLDYTPEVMFSKCVDGIVDKEIDDSYVYIKEMQLLHFGTIIVATPRTPPYVTRITLKNISQIPCYTVVELEEDSPFQINSNNFTVSSVDQVILELSLQGSQVGIVESELYISIENNPMIYRLKLFAEVVKMDFNITPKFLNFDQVPLDLSSKQHIRLVNSTPVNLKWRFVRMDWATRIYKINKLRGETKLFSSDRIEIEYKPTREEMYQPRAIEIQVFDPLCCEEIPFLVEYITLQCKAVEFLVSYTEHIDLGEVKGKKEYKLPLKVTNTGITNVQIMLEKISKTVKQFSNKVKHLFQYNMNSEILLPNKSSSIIIKFSPTEEIDFEKVPVFLCKILDPNKPQCVVKKFQLQYSGTVVLSRFTICPINNIHFGSLEVWNKRTQILQLKNVGRAVFSYNISYISKHGEETPTSQRKDVVKKPKNLKEPTKSNLNKDSLDIPGYTLHPYRGDVDTGQSVEITLAFQPTYLGVFKESVLLTVSEPAKEHVDGKEIDLYGEASEPWVDFTTYSKMFKEHHIVQNLEDYVVPVDIGSHTFLVVSQKTFYFGHVCVKHECQAKIYLQNVGQLIAVVVCKIRNSDNFTVSPTQFTIDPYLTQFITVTFKPDIISSFEGVLEISSNAATDNTFELALRGQSCVPQIKLEGLPAPHGNENSYKVYLRPTYVNQIETKKVRIVNIGVIKCQVIVDVTDNNNSIFRIVHSDEEPDFAKIDEWVASSIKVNIRPSEATNVYIVFKADNEVTKHTYVNLYTIDNPFETYKISVFGQCYGGDIFIGTLEAFKPASFEKNSLEKKSVSYILDLGVSPLKLVQKKRFTISNYSPDHTYRFEFSHDIGSLKLIPKVGHLKPFTTKEILAVNMSNAPISVKDTIQFQYIPITYMNEEPLKLSWDERQQLMSWLETGLGVFDDAYVQVYFKNCVETATDAFIASENCKRDEVVERLKLSIEREEPDVIYTAESCDVIDIVVSFTTDYAVYECNCRNFYFPDTFIRDKNHVTIKVRNSGNVPLMIIWNVVLHSVRTSTSPVEPEHKDQEDDVISTVPSLESCVSRPPETLDVHARVFAVSPAKALIDVDGTGRFRATFEPRVAGDYVVRLTADVESLHPELAELDVMATAKSLEPDYYFEIDDSDYLERRTINRCLKVSDSNLKILEIHAVGVGITTVKGFFVFNTGRQQLSFKLDPIERDTLSYISCKTRSGVLRKQKKMELVFAFTSQELGTFEEEYAFRTDRRTEGGQEAAGDEDEGGGGGGGGGIVVVSEEPAEYLETRFLIVGICRNPRVYFTRAHIYLAPTLLRIPTQETLHLCNHENEELGFKILKPSLYSYDHLQKLKIVPIAGYIPANAEVTLQLIYNAETVGESTFSIQCVIDRMTTPLTLNISSNCLEVESKIQYIDPTGEEVTLDPNNDNIIDIGKIGIKNKYVINFIFTNTGKSGFFYKWSYKMEHMEHLMNITPKKDKEFISAGVSVKRELVFQTFKKYKLVNFPMKIEIPYGPVYNLKFFVVADFPSCKLSFTNYNFGNCLIQPFFTKYYSVELTVKNFEPNPVKLDNFFEENEHLTVDFTTAIIQPQDTITIQVYFHPRKEGHYDFLIPFSLNCTKRPIKITGCGVAINLQLMNPADKFIDLGEVILGEMRSYSLFVVNRSSTQLDAKLFISDDLTTSKKEYEKLKPEITVPDVPEVVKSKKEVKKEASKMEKEKTKSVLKYPSVVRLISDVETEPRGPYFFINPKESVRMEINKKYQFTIEFRPTERLDNFSQKVYYQIQQMTAPLCSVKGKCLIREYSLDKEILNFSNVLIGATRLKYVLLRNTGDLPIKFKWKHEQLEYFKVHPVEGYVKPKTDVKIDFSFKVDKVLFQLTKKCICLINNKDPLELTLVSNSVSQPPPISTITFSCPVRQKLIQNVDIQNKTTTLWHLNPMITNKNFILPSEVVVDPESVSAIPVIYYPKTSGDDEAILILPLPDEEIVYSFIGKPLPPLPEKRIYLDVRCKQNYCQILPVYNWTDFKMCFKVENVLKSVVTKKTLYKTFGLDIVDLLPGEVKDYKWNIYTINEENLEFHVIFKDMQTEEYMFYEIVVRVMPSDPMEVVQLTTCVRNPIKTEIVLHNPINLPVLFHITTACPDLHFKNTISMEPYTKQSLAVTFCPVRAGVFTTSIDARCEELGSFSYEFDLTANQPEIEKWLKFVVELGGREYVTSDIKNAFNTTMEVHFKCDHPEFWVEKYSKFIAPGETGSFTVMFEPSSIGVLESVLTVNSTISGPYLYKLYGECIHPTPKGPFMITMDGYAQVPFFNPFNETMTFSYSLDTKTFELKTFTEEIKPKKSTKIIVTYPEYLKKTVDNPAPACVQTGRLLVTCGDVKWPFYIQTEC